MSQYHKLYTPQDSAVVFIDHQPQMTFGVANIDRASLINNVTLLAKVAKEFNVPAVLTAVETESFSGYVWPQLLDVVPGQAVVERGDGLPSGDLSAAEREAGEVDGEKAGSVENIRAAERDRRSRQGRDRVEPGADQARATEALDGEPSDDNSDRRAHDQLAREQAEHVPDPVVRLLDPVDEADHEQHRDNSNRSEEPDQAFLH
jgi:hypothetical protein